MIGNLLVSFHEHTDMVSSSQVGVVLLDLESVQRCGPRSKHGFGKSHPMDTRFPNRIREIRRAAGLTAKQLAERVIPPTTETQIARLETGERQLTVPWMTRIAEALQVSPADLISHAAYAGIASSDVEPATTVMPASVSAALKARGLVTYRVVSETVEGCGLRPGDVVTIDTTSEAIAGADAGRVVLIEVDDGNEPVLLLRVLVAGDLVATNQPGRNFAMRLGEFGDARLAGVVCD